jgi:hypothetical protein
MPKRYFAHLASYNQPKNALQIAALKILKDQSNRLVDDRRYLRVNLEALINQLNSLHPRCTPLEFRTFNFDSEQIGITLGDHFTVGFYLYAVKEVSND